MRVPTVFGVGNVLLGDEGLGVRAAEMLVLRAPRDVRVVDAGSLSPELLPLVEEASRLLVLDCIDAGRRPGAVMRLEWAEVPGPDVVPVSPHQFGLDELLGMAAFHARAPEEVVVLGIQPASLRPSPHLSAEVEASLPRLIDEALGLLGGWIADGPAAPGV